MSLTAHGKQVLKLKELPGKLVCVLHPPLGLGRPVSNTSLIGQDVTHYRATVRKPVASR